MALSVEDSKSIISDFYRANPSLTKKTAFLVRNEASELGKEYKDPYYKDLQGAYLPKDDKVIIIASNHKDKDALLLTLKHEIYGHKATYNLKILEKRALLESIIKLKKVAGVKEIWDKVDKAYGKGNVYFKAEEVYAYIAEKNKAGYNLAKNPTVEVKSLQDIKEISKHLQNEIVSGRAVQRIKPLKNSKGFRVEQIDKNTQTKSLPPKKERIEAIKKVKAASKEISTKDISVKDKGRFTTRENMLMPEETKRNIRKLESTVVPGKNITKSIRVNAKNITPKDKENIAATKKEVKSTGDAERKKVSGETKSYVQKKEGFAAYKNRNKDIKAASKDKGRDI